MDKLTKHLSPAIMVESNREYKQAKALNLNLLKAYTW